MGNHISSLLPDPVRLIRGLLAGTGNYDSVGRGRDSYDSRAHNSRNFHQCGLKRVVIYRLSKQFEIFVEEEVENHIPFLGDDRVWVSSCVCFSRMGPSHNLSIAQKGIIHCIYAFSEYYCDAHIPV